MKESPILTLTLNIFTLFIGSVSPAAEYMVTVPGSISLPHGFETNLTCEMNIQPDRFQWKFYPSNEPYNPKALIDLGNGRYHLIPENKFTKHGRKSLFTLSVNNESNAGDYQCLAYYGVYVVASVPWRVTIARIENHTGQQDITAQVVAGNTVSWRCLLPKSNPVPYISYYKNGEYVTSAVKENQSLVLQRVISDDSGRYSCRVSNTLKTVNMSSHFDLTVVQNGVKRAPYFIIEPRKSYTFSKGETVFLECAAVGNPIPTVRWLKQNRQLPSGRFNEVDGGLKITNATTGDHGTYTCNFTNSYGFISHSITLMYEEQPSIDCNINITDIKQGDNLELACQVTGTPKPHIYWFINGFSVINDSSVDVQSNKIYIKPVEKRHAGNLQIFAQNSVATVYSSITIRVIPLISTETIIPLLHVPKRRGKSNSTRKPSKHSRPPKLIPPSKPTISRLNDESVVVRWLVPDNTGLEILFFKVQYRDLGPASQHNLQNRSKGWDTSIHEIPSNIKVYDVTNLKPDHIYRFRVAAVYSNYDNKPSPISDKFHLKRLDFDNKNPLPIPLITHTETVNKTSVKVFWKFSKTDNTSVNGFYISYMSASTAGDYMKATADGEYTREYVLTHLQPDTIYDIKLQSFNTALASEFSQIMKARTEALQQQSTTTVATNLPTSNSDDQNYNFYIIVAGVLILISLVVVAVVLMLAFRKWKNKERAANDKVGVDDRHIHEGNEYMVNQKTITRSNGCGVNKITITTNPLADAGNKNQNIIEMSCLASQNNNCAAVHQESSSSVRESLANFKGKNDQRCKSKKSRLSGEIISTGDNYL